MEAIGSVDQGIEILNALAKSESVSRLVSMTYNSLFGRSIAVAPQRIDHGREKKAGISSRRRCVFTGLHRGRVGSRDD